MLASSAPGESLPPPPRSTHGTVSDIRHGVVKTHAAVSELEYGVSSTRVMVSEIHRTIVGGQEGSDGTGLSVGDTRTCPSPDGHLPLRRLKPGQNPKLAMDP